MGKHSKGRLPCVSSETYVDLRKAFLHNGRMKSELWQRIKLARTNARLTQDQVGSQLGISRAAVAQWEAAQESKRTTPSRENLKDFARITCVSLAWLYDDDSELVAGSRSVSGVSEIESGDGYVRVDQIEAEAQMGAMGRANDDYPEVIKAMDFAPAYIRSVVGFVPPAGRLKLVTGVGDSMAPKIRPGEAVLVDTGCNEFVGDGLYLINTGYGQQIKALQAAPDGIWARSSDQVLYPPFKLTEDSIIGGRVYLIHHLERVA